jgi:hypothetical protein
MKYGRNDNWTGTNLRGNPCKSQIFSGFKRSYKTKLKAMNVIQQTAQTMSPPVLKRIIMYSDANIAHLNINHDSTPDDIWQVIMMKRFIAYLLLAYATSLRPGECTYMSAKSVQHGYDSDKAPFEIIADEDRVLDRLDFFPPPIKNKTGYVNQYTIRLGKLMDEKVASDLCFITRYMDFIDTCHTYLPVKVIVFGKGDGLEDFKITAEEKLERDRLLSTTQQKKSALLNENKNIQTQIKALNIKQGPLYGIRSANCRKILVLDKKLTEMNKPIIRYSDSFLFPVRTSKSEIINENGDRGEIKSLDFNTPFHSGDALNELHRITKRLNLDTCKNYTLYSVRRGSIQNKQAEGYDSVSVSNHAGHGSHHLLTSGKAKKHAKIDASMMTNRYLDESFARFERDENYTNEGDGKPDLEGLGFRLNPVPVEGANDEDVNEDDEGANDDDDDDEDDDKD